MEIRLASLLQGAQEAAGTTIIIDVFRAFTTAAVAFERGATQIVLVAEIDEALALRRRGVGHRPHHVDRWRLEPSSVAAVAYRLARSDTLPDGPCAPRAPARS